MQKKTSWKKIFLRLLLAFLAVYIVVSLLDMQVKLSERQKELAGLQQKVELQEVENKELERKINAGMDDEKLERDARENLDFIGENERVFVDRSGT